MCGGSDTGGGRPPSADAGAAFATRSAPVADENRAARSEPLGAPKGCGRPSDVTGAAAATAAAAAAVAAAAAAAAEEEEEEEEEEAAATPDQILWRL